MKERDLKQGKIYTSTDQGIIFQFNNNLHNSYFLINAVGQFVDKRKNDPGNRGCCTGSRGFRDATKEEKSLIHQHINRVTRKAEILIEIL